MIKENNEFAYEKFDVQKMSSPIETVASIITNVVERLRYANQQYKPNVRFEGNVVHFITNSYQIVDSRTSENLKKQFANIFKTILEKAKQDLLDSGADYDFSYSFIKDDLTIQNSRGFGSKSFIVYTQDWKFEII